MKAEKIMIGEGIAEGGLFDLQQKYIINYLEKEKNYSDKIELVILLKKKDDKNYAYRSLRFVSERQFKKFIIELCLAYIYFSFKRTSKDLINERLLLDYLNDLTMEIDLKVRDFLSGLKWN